MFMKICNFYAILIVSFLCACQAFLPRIATLHAKQPQLKLWYNKPATKWMTSALPIGNGEFGAMFFGGVVNERVQFNEKTVWTGSPSVRGAYQNFGDLYLDFLEGPECTDYNRELSLDNAMGTVSYKVNKVTYVREYFASNPDSVIVIRLTTPGSVNKLNFRLRLSDAHSGTMDIMRNGITMRGSLDLISYEAQVRIVNEGGIVKAGDNHISVENANAVTILLVGGTNYSISSATYIEGGPKELHERISRRITYASSKSYKALKESHLKDYRSLFDRVRLDLEATMPNMPTDELLRTYRDSKYLDMLYFQYGRYLMISSSRGMNLPNNLQGIWNDSNSPAWQCDIHSNINVQMNYWPAENTNLSECHLPFLNYIAVEALKHDGSWQKVAKKEKLRGWAMHTQNNIFGYTNWNINRPANAWYCMHLWQHYAYTNDLDFLQKCAFPVMKRACEYWLDRLVENNERQWVAPSEWSPEQGPWEDGVAYAQQLIYELFNSTLNASQILHVDPSFVKELGEKLKQLDKGVTIGEWGQIREWKHSPDVQGNIHRHLSHLIALYPGNQISYHLDSLYADAAKKSLESRGDGATGWSRAWKISCWARLFDGEHAYKLLKQALNLTYATYVTSDDKAGGVYENLLDAHPSYQIDGNFGATAGITEMLMQSNQGFIQLLPALPEVWSNGRCEGIKGIGNFVVDLYCKKMELVSCSIHSNSGEVCKLYYPGIGNAKITTLGRQRVKYNRINENMVSFPTVKGRDYKITF